MLQTGDNNAFFTPRAQDSPAWIYAYGIKANSHRGALKIGMTVRKIEERIEEQLKTSGFGKLYQVEGKWCAMRKDGTGFSDKDVHRALLERGVKHARNLSGGEWFLCDVKDIEAAVIAVHERTLNAGNRTQNFAMRPEQERAVEKTWHYFDNIARTESQVTPKFLWNAKMRFGKTFAAYQLAKRLECKKVLILTFKPAVQSAWQQDLLAHVDFEGWQFICRPADAKGDNIDVQYERADKDKPLVCFGSFQDFLGTDGEGGIKAKNQWVHATHWDLVIFDEYHFGAWKDSAKKLFQQDDEEKDVADDHAGNDLSADILPITTSRYLFLSGTPFKALQHGEFIEEQIFNWTYADEQQAKAVWRPEQGENPYAALPRINLLVYNMPERIRRIAEQGEFDSFDLNEFFKAKEGDKNEPARFEHEESVQHWLDLIRGVYQDNTTRDLKLGKDKAAMPFENPAMRKDLAHTLWRLPDVAACFAMKNLLEQDSFYREYAINVCAGPQAGIGVKALPPVLDSMQAGKGGLAHTSPLNTKTITLTCGKLTTGVTVAPWTGVFMLCNLASPESYFQTAFRVQSPWTMQQDNGEQVILKKDCYIFDFAPYRALRQIADYSAKLGGIEQSAPEQVKEFIDFLPVLQYEGGTLQRIDAEDILDIISSGTTATLLARRWESALLVNVDNFVLEKLLHNEQACAALQNLEGFRNLNLRPTIEKIIGGENKLKKPKKPNSGKKPTDGTSEEEKERRSKRKEIQDNLIKFATRIPIFMYLSDYREEKLTDIIQKLEPELFHKVTGMTVPDFNLLLNLGVFNTGLLNEAIFNFKRYEDDSLRYTGIDRSLNERVGGFDTTISREEFDMYR